MAFLSRMAGVIGSYIQLGLGGPLVQNNGGAVEVRTANNLAMATLRAADPVGNTDVVTKQYLVAHPSSSAVDAVDQIYYPLAF